MYQRIYRHLMSPKNHICGFRPVFGLHTRPRNRYGHSVPVEGVYTKYGDLAICFIFLIVH